MNLSMFSFFMNPTQIQKLLLYFRFHFENAFLLSARNKEDCTVKPESLYCRTLQHSRRQCEDILYFQPYKEFLYTVKDSNLFSTVL